ncbi:MAG: hypothetical protein ACJAXN_002216, partial [Psychromonas sp.]
PGGFISINKTGHKFNGDLICTPTSTNHDNNRMARRVPSTRRLLLPAVHKMHSTDRTIANALIK